MNSKIEAFILANTKLLSPPLLPELRLHLAEESLPIWRKTEEELGEMNVPPPYWAFAWAGGQALARYILDNQATVAGRSVMDIGTGSGLLAIAAKMAGARHVIANDVDAFAIEACRLNADANSVALEIRATNLISRTPPESMAPDIVLLGDLFYDRDMAVDVIAFADVARERDARVLVGDPRRSYFPESRFEMVVEYAVPVTRELEDNEIKNAAVWQLTN